MSPLAQSPEATPSSADPVQATKDKPLANSLGMKFVPVPGTDILMCIHETRKGDYRMYAGENSSIHVGWAAVVSFGIVATSTSRWRWVFLLHVVITVIAVSATGHHWWVDGLVAIALLWLGLWADTAVRRSLERTDAMSDEQPWDARRSSQQEDAAR